MRSTSKRKMAAVMLIGTALATGAAFLGIASPAAIAAAKDEFPKTSPFSAVRWVDSKYQVQVKDKWYELVAINDQPAGKIIDYARDTFKGDLWQKRIDEDLPEVLTAMGSKPGDTVTLKLRTLDTHDVVTLNDVHMTSANRWAIWAARNKPVQTPATQPAPTTAPSGRVS